MQEYMDIRFPQQDECPFDEVFVSFPISVDSAIQVPETPFSLELLYNCAEILQDYVKLMKNCLSLNYCQYFNGQIYILNILCDTRPPEFDGFPLGKSRKTVISEALDLVWKLCIISQYTASLLQ